MMESTSKADDAAFVEEEDQEVVTKWSKRLLHRCFMIWSQLTIQEISGSFGDLGTLIPLYIALARQNLIHPGPALFFAGLANVTTGFSWDVPMCVQPMKSISAVAIAEGLTQQQVTTAGICMGTLMLFLGFANLIEWVNVIIPDSVVSGIQVGVGINLAIHGLMMIRDLEWIDTRSGDCMLLAIICSILSLYLLRNKSTSNDRNSNKNKQEPLGLYLFLLGSLLATIEMNRDSSTENINKDTGDDSHFIRLRPYIATWALVDVTWKDWQIGLLEGALPQLPLSTVNSVISVCALAHTLYPEKHRARPTVSNHYNDAVVSRQELCLSVGWMNLLFVPLGGMPNCHGAGGLAGQHRLGARHGSSVVFLGFGKMLLALLFGGSMLLVFLEALPTSILGVMLLLSGHELATTGFSFLIKSINRYGTEDYMDRLRKSAVVMILTALILIGFKKVHYAAGIGWVAHMIYGDGFTYLLKRQNIMTMINDEDEDQPSQRRQKHCVVRGDNYEYDLLLQQVEEDDD